jgi:hypothetical protein
VAKHDGLTLAPVLVEDFRAVLRLDCTHFFVLLILIEVPAIRR